MAEENLLRTARLQERLGPKVDLAPSNWLKARSGRAQEPFTGFDSAKPRGLHPMQESNSPRPLRSLAFRHLEAIPGAPHRFQIAGVLRIDLDLFANTAHINVHGTRCHEARVAPNRIQQMV